MSRQGLRDDGNLMFGKTSTEAPIIHLLLRDALGTTMKKSVTRMRVIAATI